MIKTVLFDLDETLLDFHKAEAAAISNTLKELGIEPTEATVKRYSEINLSQWKLLEKELLTRDELLVRRFDLLFEELGVEHSSLQAWKTYEKFLGQGHYFIEGAEELLEELAPEYQLYLVSNGTASVQKGRIQSADITKYFQKIFISQSVGYNKPRKEFFDCCFAEMPQIKKEETIIIGDSLTSDIQGGINAGIHTCWFNPKGITNDTKIIPEYEIAKLKQLPELLKKL